MNATYSIMGIGRPALQTHFKKIKYNNNSYVVASKSNYKYVIDEDIYDDIQDYNWYKISTGYIATNYTTVDGTRKQLLLHNFIMNRLTFPGKGATESVDHINRNPLDNRKENLRIVSQTEQNINQGKKPRNIVQLPENSGIEPDDIPRHIWYIKANGGHGDRFAIEFKTENLVWKTSSSKKLSLQEKLNSAKQRLQELYIQYPYLNPENNTTVNHAEELTKSFQEIVEMAKSAAT